MQLEELNIKPKNWKDLLTEEPFTRKDIIHLQDPLNLSVSWPQARHAKEGRVAKSAEVHPCGGAAPPARAALLRPCSLASTPLQPARSRWGCRDPGPPSDGGGAGLAERCAWRRGRKSACSNGWAQGKTVDKFDHVVKGLVLDEEPDQDAPGSSLRNVTEDMKRALGALQVRWARCGRLPRPYACSHEYAAACYARARRAAIACRAAKRMALCDGAAEPGRAWMPTIACTAQSTEAKAAFEAGGGGKRAEAMRLLAAAKNLAASAKDKAAKASKAAAASDPNAAGERAATPSKCSRVCLRDA